MLLIARSYTVYIYDESETNIQYTKAEFADP